MSIVRDLQKMALDSKCDITELIRKAWFAARKLKVKELEIWANYELQGYLDTVPKYREIRGEVKVRNSFHGWLPVTFKEDEWAEKISLWHCGISIAEIQALLMDSETGYAMASFNNNVEQLLMSVMVTEYGYRPNFQPKLKIPTTKLRAILDAARNQVLDWAIKLEEDGIMGEDMVFSDREILKASARHYTINNFHATVSHSQIQQHSVSSSQTMTSGVPEFEVKLQQLMESIQNAKEATDVQIELAEAHIATLHSQAHLPREKRSRNLVDKASKSLSKISETLSITKNFYDLTPLIIRLFS